MTASEGEQSEKVELINVKTLQAEVVIVVALQEAGSLKTMDRF